MSVIDQIKHGLIVSCQALENEPLHGSEHMAVMAKAAEESGAIAIRANGSEDIKAIKKIVKLPVIGIYKNDNYNSDVFITPTFKEAKEVYAAGADIIAIDATKRPRPDGVSLGSYIKRIKEELNIPVMADISTFEEGIEAQEQGVDLVATTLSGYTDYSKQQEGPDFDLLVRLVNKLKVPVIMEGKIFEPEEFKKALDLGAHAVVVGSAITRPQVITARFINAIKG